MYWLPHTVKRVQYTRLYLCSNIVTQRLLFTVIDFLQTRKTWIDHILVKCLVRGDERHFKCPPVKHQDRPWGRVDWDVTCDMRKEVKLVIEPADIICLLPDRLLHTSFNVMTSLIHHVSLIIGIFLVREIISSQSKMCVCVDTVETWKLHQNISTLLKRISSKILFCHHLFL